MPSKDNKAGTKKSVTKLSKSKKSTLANQTIDTENRDARHEMIATAAYYRAEKRSFKGNGADAAKDWLEAEVEIDNALDVSGIDYQFLTSKAQKLNRS